ncbi:MAG TPA: UPF0158 family protein [Thermoanaerobaculia bacterium]|nr:UPF0158 family protein [Thermoanaerobaculia bacterium]
MSAGGPASVDLARLTDELESLFDGATVYVDRRTGDVVTLMDSDVGAIEDGETDFEPEGGDEILPLFHEIVETTHWVAMPDKFEIDEWQIMSDFADAIPDRIGDELARAIRGRGAFRMFRDAIYRHEIQDDWFEFKRKAMERIAIRALEAKDIPYHRRPHPKFRESAER